MIDYHSSGGYDAELEDVITNAQLYASMMPAPANQTAWVFDIDETTLSGYEQMKSIGFGYVAKINHDWVSESTHSGRCCTFALAACLRSILVGW